ncbi:ankyrin-1 [Elysia marginata]|uniref:Ankyrin-1 n=1 Tax=Elysia marginata TaxID=1093978 RepID=A0AAV4EHQ1_9GAST|nr:ankyrin-1 [Elysia marginata]
MKPLLTNNKISFATRRVLQCYIEPILMYGCETWTINKKTHGKLKAVEMWFWRRMLRIPWTAIKTNEEVLNETETTRSLINRTRKRQATFVGHIMRREGLENLLTMGKLEGGRGKGRQREKMLDGLTSWMKAERVTELLLALRDRDVWKDMIANAMEQGTVSSLEDEDTFGNTPLVFAAEKGSLKLLQLYLSHGAEVNRVSHSGTTALHYAAKHGWTECCELLLQHGAEIDAQDIRRFTPLMMASLEGQAGVLKIMLAARCNVNMAAYNRRTALHYASERGFQVCCELLLEAGACIESIDTDKCSPAMVAAHKGSAETLQLLLDVGAKTTGWTRQGMSILHLASESGSIACCDLLIERGFNRNIRCCDGATPLVSAIRSHRISCAHHLIDRGCSLAQRPGDVVTPLGEAVSRGVDPRLVHRLLVKGANPNTVDRFHTLPLWHAVHDLNYIVVKLLLQANSNHWKPTESMLYICSPCSPVSHTLHRDSPTLVRWMLAAYPEEAGAIFRATLADRNFSGQPSSETILLVQELTSSPQPLLRLCRRVVRRQLGAGFSVQEKISNLRLPSLLHSYLLFSDLDIPR